MNTVKISARQFAILVTLFSTGTAILIIPGAMAQAAAQDAWLGAFIGTCTSLLLVALYNLIGRKYPTLTIIEMNETILGKWIGKLVSFSLIFFSFYASAISLSDVGNFVSTQLMPETPNAAIQIIFVLIVIMGIRLGLETLARSAEILFGLFVVLFIFGAIVVLPQAELKNIQPMFDSSNKHIIKSIFIYISIFSLPLVVLLMIFPSCVQPSKKAGKSFYMGILLAGLCLNIMIVVTTMVLGPYLSAHQMYASYAVARMMKIGDFLQRVEAIIAGMWMISLYFKLSLYFYAVVIGLAQTLKLHDHRPLTLPIGMVLLIFSLIINPNVVITDTFNAEVWPVYALTYGFFLPLLLVAVHLVRSMIQRNNNQKK
ncbi:endospore germination permease [Neobacillus mesonae]|uniref:GerAB/ArcD/ProY family transporter n=1 Tax=Neobacillus mesonae TaxID=1193713 RepID=UPI002E1A42AD|nr:endospore germination permease [Neobacillus mesonae]MED4207363.1 endospore germination permease [Neobacillus mesonae]